MAEYLVIGIDPGLVHTGVVGMVFRRPEDPVEVRDILVDGSDVQAVKRAVTMLLED